MPSPIRFFRKDPNKKGRGRGIYYLRGNGYYSLYNIDRDFKIKAKGWRKHRTGLPPKGKKSTSIPHTGDGQLSR